MNFFMKVFFVFSALAFVLTAGMPAIAYSGDATENFEVFVTNLIERAHVLTDGKRYFDQDAEFVEDEMNGDEMVYMRTWQGEGFFTIYGCSDDTWKDDYVAYFWANDPGLKINGIGVGSSLAELKSVFEDILDDDPSTSSCNAMLDGMYLTFAIADGKVSALRYAPEISMTMKMTRYVEAYEQSLVTPTKPAEVKPAPTPEVRPTPNQKTDYDAIQRASEIDYCERNIRGATQSLEANKRWLAEELRKKKPNPSQIKGFQNAIAAKEKELAQYQARLQKALAGK